MTVIAKLVIALLLVASVGQASATFFAADNAHGSIITTPSHVMAMSQPSAHQQHVQDFLSECEMIDCQCLNHGCSSAFSGVIVGYKINTSAPGIQIYHLIPAWLNAEQRSLFRPPISA